MREPAGIRARAIVPEQLPSATAGILRSVTVIERTKQKKRFAADFGFTKQASKAPEAGEGDLELTGYANTWVQDRDGDWMARDAFDKSLGEYLEKNPILLYQHNMNKPLGVVNEMFTDGTGLFARCTVPKPEDREEDWKHTAYHDCRRGVLRTFSIGGFFTYDIENWGEEDEKWIIAEVELLELSVVSIPSNPDSIFEAAQKAIKADGEDARGDRLSDKAFAQMLQLLGIEALTDPDLAGMDGDAKLQRYGALSTMFEHVKGRPAPAADAYHKLVAPLEDAPLSARVAALPAIEELVDYLHAAPSAALAPGTLSKANHDRLTQAIGLLNELVTQIEG